MVNETKSVSQESNNLIQDANSRPNLKESKFSTRSLVASAGLNLTNNFGIEVQEVEFVEFDRRKNSISEIRSFKFERRGFLENLETLIRDLDR